MKTLSVADLARLPWNTPVEGVVGVIQMVHPKMGKAGWSLQNGRLADVDGQPLVEFMLSKHNAYWEPEKVRGLRVEFHATQPDDLVWREQKAKPNVNRGQPFAKLEVAATARIVFPNEAEPALPGFASASSRFFTPPARELAPLPLPADPRTERPVAAPTAPIAAGGSAVSELRTQLRQMLGLHAVVERVVSEEVKVDERPLLQERLFAQACAAGLFRGIDPETVAIELDPRAFALRHPNLTRLAEMAAGREDMLNLMLRGLSVISMSETWRNVSEESAGKVLQRGELVQAFAKAV